jgi:hypothetical protein
MDYPKIVESVPAEKLGPLSDQLLNYVLTTKNEGKMPTTLANSMLSKMQQGAIKSAAGVAVLLEAAVALEPEKTMAALGEMQLAQLAEALKGGV